VIWKTRYICDAHAELVFDRGIWDVREVSCDGAPCSVGKTCPDMWKPGAKKGAGGKPGKRR
jgi:hypothetical protein